MFNDPIAYFLTFTVRGSWLHGDQRGSWKRDGQFIAPGAMVGAMHLRNSPHFFSEEECRIVEKSIEEVCSERKWTLHEKSVLGNHVHVVLTAAEIKPERVMQLFKSKATMRLRKGGFIDEEEKIWTQHGSTKYLFDEEALETVREYVRNQ